MVRGITHGVVADANCGGNVGEGPEAALGVVDALFLEILEFLLLLMAFNTGCSTHVARGLPVAVPAPGCLFERLDRGFVFRARA